MPTKTKQGVSKISGDPAPKVGAPTTYTIVEWYPDTPQAKRNPALVTWELFKKRENGSFTTTNIKKKGDGTFTFGEVSSKYIYRLEAYLNEPEGGGLTTIDISPQQTVVPKINKVELLYIDDSKGSVFSYMEKMVAKAQCVNLTGEKLMFTLWEDDAKGDGHDNKNLFVDKKEGTVARNGVASVEFLLTKALVQKASKGEIDAKELEFYVTVEYYKDKKHASDNINVKNPEYKPQAPPPSSKPTPKIPPKAKDSPAAQKEPSNKEKGMVDQAVDWFKELWDWGESSGTVKPKQQPKPQKPDGKATSTVNDQGNPVDCGGKYCIKKGDKSELIREVNIRLAGFGGNVPTDVFTDKTEKMIKQFQKDYMKVPETGKICGNVLRAIDDFSTKFDISAAFWGQIKCSCGTKGKQATSKLRGVKETNNCGGFGDGTGKGTYKSTSKTEPFHKYEYPGLHRSLLFGFKALRYYFSLQKTYTIDSFSSGYRCRFKNYTTTNHQGKAIDMQFSKGNWAIRGAEQKNLKELRDMRDTIFVKYLGAQKEWPDKDKFSIEPIDLLYDKNKNLRYDHTFSWIHMDVREFSAEHLEDKYFCKTATELNGKSIVQLAKELGQTKVCECMSGSQAPKPPAAAKTGTCYCTKDLTEEVLVAVGVSKDKAKTYLEALNKTMTDYKINTCLRKSHFLAQLIHESGNFKYTAELNVADTAYGGYKGRGLIQLTGAGNYKRYGDYESQDFTSSLANKKKLEALPYSVRSAGWYWTELKKINENADVNDLIYITRIINGGLNGYNDRLKYFKKAYENMYSSCKDKDEKKTDEFVFKDSKAYNDKRGSFAWGLWHDPGLDKSGCTKDKAKAIEGYSRFIALAGDKFEDTNWYNIQKMTGLSSIRYYVKKKEGNKMVDVAYAKVLKAAQTRLKALQGT